GLSELIGAGFVGSKRDTIPRLDIPGLSHIPFVGPILFGQNALVYLSVALVAAVWWFLYRSRAGLVLRAVGDSHASAHPLGYLATIMVLGIISARKGRSGAAPACLGIPFMPDR